MPPSIVVLEGSTGVGKTTLAQAVTRDVREGLIGPSHPEPCGVVTAICPKPGPNGLAFDMGFWHTLAQSGGSPIPGAHRHPDAEAARLSRGFVTGMRPTVESTRRGTLEFLRARGVRLVVIDEAQHITETRGGQALARHLDVIKISVDASEITFLLVGTYALRALILPNGQLGRRTKTVHFRTYHPDSDGDFEAFRCILLQLIGALPLEDPGTSIAQFDPHVEEILFYTAGCVGVLKEWLLAALVLALECGKRYVPWTDMAKVRPDDNTLLAIASDIHAYREERGRANRSEIERKLGYGPRPSASRQTPKLSQSSKSSSKGRSKPGTRGPARDPVYPSRLDKNL